MSTESLNKTPITENYISKKTPKKVNIDVLKRKIYEQQKKEKTVGRIAIFTFFSFICVIGFIISYFVRSPSLKESIEEPNTQGTFDALKEAFESKVTYY